MVTSGGSEMSLELACVFVGQVIGMRVRLADFLFKAEAFLRLYEKTLPICQRLIASSWRGAGFLVRRGREVGSEDWRTRSNIGMVFSFSVRPTLHWM